MGLRTRFSYTLLVPALVATLLLVATACGGSATEPPATEAPAPVATTAAPAVTTAPAAAKATQAPATAVPVPTAAPVVGVAETTEYSEAAQLLRSGGPLALADAHGETPRHGGKFLANNWEPVPSYDSHQITFGGVYVSTAPAYNGLLAQSPYDPLAQQIIPDLAHSWEFAQGGKQLIFHLTEGVRWHDGMPFSSADVLTTMNRVVDPPEGMVSTLGPNFASLVDNFEAPDANTFVVNLKAPSGLITTLFANGWLGMYAKHLLDEDPVGAMKTQVMGTGAFRLKEKPSSTLWQYERNPDYFEEGLPYLDEIDYHIIIDAQTQAAALLTQRIYWNDALGGINYDADLRKSTTEREPRIVYKPTIGTIHFSLTVNTTKPPVDDIRVRQAISESFRRADFYELGPNDGVVGTGNFPLGPWGMPTEMREQLIGYGPDMEVRRENARRLLAEYEAEKGEIDWSKIPIVCASNLTWSCAHALIMKQSLEKIGVEVKLQPGDVTQVRGGEVAGDWELSTIGAWMDFDDPVDTCNTLYVTNGGRWYQRSSIPELDKICEQLTFETDFEERRRLAWEMDKLAMNDSAWVILFWSQWNGLHWDFVKGFVYSSVKGTSNPRMKYIWLTCDAPTANC